jgi:peptidoglycan/LPS O-acetylase OafA/YrhL
MPEERSLDYRPQLDTLRFLAFLVVFLYHANGQRYPYGLLGVPLFFVLSGFLITRVLLLHRSRSFGRDLGVFYARRTLRIFPVYYAVLLVLLPLGRLDDPGPAWYFVYLHNVYLFFYDPWWVRATIHFWSLCVEEQFYLLYPLLLLLTPSRWRTLLLVLLLAGSIVTRLTLDRLYPNSRSWALLPVAGEYLLWGCLAGLYDLDRGERPVPVYWLLAAGVLLHVLAALDQGVWNLLDSRWQASRQQTIHGIGFALIIFAVWRMPSGPLLWLLTLAPIVYLGRISYGLYIFHNFCYGIKERLVERLPWLQPVPGPVVAFAATVALAVLSWHLYEGPINRLKRYFPYRYRG